jgi:hypothetical protein
MHCVLEDQVVETVEIICSRTWPATSLRSRIYFLWETVLKPEVFNEGDPEPPSKALPARRGGVDCAAQDEETPTNLKAFMQCDIEFMQCDIVKAHRAARVPPCGRVHLKEEQALLAERAAEQGGPHVQGRHRHGCGVERRGALQGAAAFLRLRAG